MAKLDPFNSSRILQDEVFNKCVTILKDRYKDQWMVSPTPEQRERLYQKVSLLSEVMNELQNSIDEYQRGSE